MSRYVAEAVVVAAHPCGDCVRAVWLAFSPMELSRQLDSTLQLHAVQLDPVAAMEGYLTMRLQHPLALTGCALLMLAQNASPRNVYWNQAQVRACALSGETAVVACTDRRCSWHCFGCLRVVLTEHASRGCEHGSDVVDVLPRRRALVPRCHRAVAWTPAGVVEPGAGAPMPDTQVRARCVPVALEAAATHRRCCLCVGLCAVVIDLTCVLALVACRGSFDAAETCYRRAVARDPLDTLSAVRQNYVDFLQVRRWQRLRWSMPHVGAYLH